MRQIVTVSGHLSSTRIVSCANRCCRSISCSIIQKSHQSSGSQQRENFFQVTGKSSEPSAPPTLGCDGNRETTRRGERCDNKNRSTVLVHSQWDVSVKISFGRLILNRTTMLSTKTPNGLVDAHRPATVRITMSRARVTTIHRTCWMSDTPRYVRIMSYLFCISVIKIKAVRTYIPVVL